MADFIIYLDDSIYFTSKVNSPLLLTFKPLKYLSFINIYPKPYPHKKFDYLNGLPKWQVYT